MSRLERMKSYLPEHFAESPEIIAILEDGDRRFNEMDSAMDDVLNQFFVETATWGLDKWEEELEILSSGTDFEERRKQIFSKLISHTPTHYKAIENEINRFLSESSSMVRLIKGRYAMRVSIPLQESIDGSYRDIKNKVEEIKPAHLRALYYLNEVVKLSNLPSVLSASFVKMAFSSVPWMQAGFGSQGEAIQLDGTYLLNGERFLNGFYNKDGPVHLQRIKLVIKVLHDFGIHDVSIAPLLDGEYRLNGEIYLQNQLQNVRLAVKQDVSLAYKKQVNNQIESIDFTSVKAKSKTSSNPWAFAGGGYGSESIHLDGAYRLKGERYLNGYYNTDGPVYSATTRFIMKALHDFEVPAKQEAFMKIKRRDSIEIKTSQKLSTLCTVNSMSGIKTLNGTHDLSGNTLLDQTLYEHKGLFRIKKSGKTIEEVAI